MTIIFSSVIVSCEKDHNADEINQNPIEIGSQRIKRIIAQSNNTSTYYYEFKYENDKLVKIFYYTIEGDTTNSEYDNFEIKYQGDKISKEYYRKYSSGMIVPETYYVNTLNEYLLSDNKIVQISSKSKLINDENWSAPGIDTYEYNQNKLTKHTFYYMEISDDGLEGYEDIIYSGDSLIQFNYYSIDYYNDTTALLRDLKFNDNLMKEAILIYPQDHPIHDTIRIVYTYNASNKMISAASYDNLGSYIVNFEYNEYGLLSKQTLPESNMQYLYEYEDGTGNADIIWHNPEDFIFIMPYEINIMRK